MVVLREDAQVGNGANMKLVVNMVMGSMMASFAEGLTLAEKAGLKKEDFIEACSLADLSHCHWHGLHYR